jgi:hypothetical protein
MGKKLAIRGHSTRGKEVIELLEMLGGINDEGYIGTNTWKDEYYFLDNGCIRTYDWGDDIKFTLEEFLEKYPFKVGDKAVYTKYGDNCDDYPVTIVSMKWTGTTIEYTFDDYVTCLAKDLKMWNEVNATPTNKDTDDIKPDNGKCERTHEDVIFDSIIWHLRNSVNNGKQNLSGGECEEYFREVVKKNNENKMKTVLADLIEHIKTTSKEDLEREFEEIAEWSNVGPTVEEFRTFCECVNKKSKYPKTYEECCKILDYNGDYFLTTYDNNGNPSVIDDILKSVNVLTKLLICRNAYWKIAGEQMGLDKPWKPDWNNISDKYTIYPVSGEIWLDKGQTINTVLAFPTVKMRDAFYENFKDLIDQCKKLL